MKNKLKGKPAPGVKLVEPLTKKRNLTGQPETEIIKEEEEEQNDEHSEQEKWDKDIQDFLKNSRIQMQRQNRVGHTLEKPQQFMNHQ